MSLPTAGMWRSPTWSRIPVGRFGGSPCTWRRMVERGPSRDAWPTGGGQALLRDDGGRWQRGIEPSRPTTEGGTLRVNFPGPPGAGIEHVRFSKLWERILRGDPLAEFRGRVCLLGGEAPLSQDLVSSPYSMMGYSTIGVDVHAAALNTMLTGRAILPAPAWAWSAMILVMALLVAFAGGLSPVGLGADGLAFTGRGARCWRRRLQSPVSVVPVVAPCGGRPGFGLDVERLLSVEPFGAPSCTGFQALPVASGGR